MSEKNMKNGETAPDNSDKPEMDQAWKKRFDDAGAAKGEDCLCDDLPSPERNGEIPLPKVDFSTFMLSLASSALVHLGEVPNPENGKSEVNLQLAKHTIDIICMLQDKIQNGLDSEEARLLEGLLYEVRMKYVIKAS